MQRHLYDDVHHGQQRVTFIWYSKEKRYIVSCLLLCIRISFNIQFGEYVTVKRESQLLYSSVTMATDKYKSINWMHSTVNFLYNKYIFIKFNAVIANRNNHILHTPTPIDLVLDNRIENSAVVLMSQQRNGSNRT